MSLEIEVDRKSHAVSILDRVEEMLKREAQCDFTIRIGSKELKAHHLILAAATGYFGSIDEATGGYISITNLDFDCVRVCVDFIYNKNVSIPVEKCEDLMYTANEMQLDKFCDYICTTLGKKLDSQLFFATRKIANMYGHKVLEEKCVKFAEENFVSISKEEGFRDLDMEYVHKMISSKNVKMTEEKKLDVVLRFVKVEKKRRKQLAEMIEWVDLGKVSLKQRKEIMENEPLVSKNLKVYKIFATSTMMLTVTNQRQQIAFTLFDELSQSLLKFNPRDNTVKYMKNKPDRTKGTLDYFAITVDEYVCVLAKQTFHRFKYSDVTSSWKQMPDMLYIHGVRPLATATMGCMYVGGGSVVNKTAEFEKFDFSDGYWEPLHDMPRASRDSAMLASSGNIYNIGGGVENDVTNKVDRFNIDLSTWAEVAPMKYARRAPAAVKGNGSIFVLGGWDGEKIVTVVEWYCIAPDQWTEIKPMKIARKWFKAFAIDGAIYAVGGWKSGDAKKSIEKYEFERDEWEVLELPGRKLDIYDAVEIKI